MQQAYKTLFSKSYRNRKNDLYNTTAKEGTKNDIYVFMGSKSRVSLLGEFMSVSPSVETVKRNLNTLY